MSSRSWLGRGGVVVIVLACGAWLGTRVDAQAPAGAPGAGDVELDPIKCWWRTDKDAVHIGEQFTLVLTCGVVETSRIKILPDLSQLEPTVVQLTPFEVLGGTRHKDIQAPPWRYFQYEYTLRLLGDTFFGQDIDIPLIKVTYKVESVSSGGTQGRDQTYALPALPMRIMSLVPKRATDIKDASPRTFADIEARLFRATGELVAAAIFFGFAVVLVGLALVRIVGHYGQRAAAVARPLPLGTVLGGCLRGIGRLKSDVAREGWTPELAGRALTVFRIAGAVALGRPVAQTLVDIDVPGREGQLVLRKGILRPRRALVSAPTRANATARPLANANGKGPGPRTQAMLEDIRASLHVFNAVRYSRNGHVDTTALDAALDNGATAIRRLRFAKRWPVRTAGALAKSAAGLGGMVWSR